MILQRIRVQNFKLLRDIDVTLSCAPDRPLTVIRAENGSGKTSLHYAIIWGLYGMKGLKAMTQPKDLALASKATPAGTPVTVQVALDFEITDEYGSAEYRLERTVLETPQGAQAPVRTREEVTLSKVTSAGHEIIEQPELWLEQWLPERLADVFFTNGDDVQKFITGRLETRTRQEKVHFAIKSLLGINQLHGAVADIEAAYQGFYRKAAKDVGGAYDKLVEERDRLTRRVAELDEDYGRREQQLANMRDDLVRKKRELEEIKGIGDLDLLNEEIRNHEKDLEQLESLQKKAFDQIGALFKSEALSRAVASGSLASGAARLEALADLRVIPNTSIPTLEDRLLLGVCICDADLSEGTASRQHVEDLLVDQKDHSELSARLTNLRHNFRGLSLVDQADFTESRSVLLGEVAKLREAIKSKTAQLNAAKERRHSIDQSEVKRLTSDIQDLERKERDTTFQLGRSSTERDTVRDQLGKKADELAKAERTVTIAKDHQVRRDVGQDLLALARAVTAALEGPYVQRVSDKLNAMFMDILGADDSSTLGVFTSVRITDAFDIEVGSQNLTSLDPDFEVNGASQRALTLAFIWSLMEVAGTVAPRFIDTPLGMVSGDTKWRMVDAITKPTSAGQTPYQVVLLLTRSEIAGVEKLLDERAGAFTTLSCSQHYPKDLVNQWATDAPYSRACPCSHREQCAVCARRHDNELKLRYVERGEAQ